MWREPCWASSASTSKPYPLHRQKAFIVLGIVPERYVEVLETVPTWDEWDPDQDRWHYDPEVV